MARRRRSSPLEDMLDVLAMLPWWVGVGLAIASFLWLHHLATPVVIPAAVKAGQVATIALDTVKSTLSGIAQYVIPLICLTGAALSFWRRKHRESLISDVAQTQSANALDGMSWREFEMLVGEAYRQQGFRVSETGGGGADGGVDLVLTKGSEKFLVQCKQWKAFKVGVDVVRELFGVMAAKGATGGFVVTSGRFTDDAKAFTEGRNIELVDGPRLFAMIKQAKQTLPPAATESSNNPTMGGPACPQCGANMVKRTARKGSNSGAMFWGCSTYPSCKGIRQIE